MLFFQNFYLLGHKVVKAGAASQCGSKKLMRHLLGPISQPLVFTNAHLGGGFLHL
jgi:hypothetical protein